MSNVLELCQGLESVNFNPGEVLLPEGEKTGCLYVLISGKVEVTQGETIIATVREPGSILGELSVLLDLPHQVTVTAKEASRFYVSRGGRAFLASHPELTLFVAELLAKRLKGMIGYLADLKAQYEDRKDHLGMVDEVLMNLSHRVPR